MGSKKVDESVKWQLIGLKKAGGLSNVQIGKCVGVSERCVRNTWKKFQETDNVQDKVRSGRPKKFTDVQVKEVVRCARKNPKMSCLDITRSCSVSMSRSTVSRVLRKNKFHNNTSLLKPSEQLKRKSLNDQSIHQI
jgi:transposase